MIFCLEGPDCCGKTTALAEVRRIAPDLGVFVPSPPMHRALWPVMEHVERRDLSVWQAHYDPRKVYLCDRHVCLSGRAYARLFGRPEPDASWLDHAVVALYLDADEALLRSRERADDNLEPRAAELIRIYEELLPGFRHYRIDARMPPRAVGERVVEIVRGCLCC